VGFFIQQPNPTNWSLETNDKNNIAKNSIGIGNSDKEEVKVI
jgi:hypothetical protein